MNEDLFSQIKKKEKIYGVLLWQTGRNVKIMRSFLLRDCLHEMRHESDE